MGGIPPCSCKKQRPAPPPASLEAEPSKKFSFPFRRKKSGARKRELQRKLFCWVASGSEWRRGGFIRRGFAGNAFGFCSGYGARLDDASSPPRGFAPRRANGPEFSTTFGFKANRLRVQNVVRRAKRGVNGNLQPILFFRQRQKAKR